MRRSKSLSQKAGSPAPGFAVDSGRCFRSQWPVPSPQRSSRVQKISRLKYAPSSAATTIRPFAQRLPCLFAFGVPRAVYVSFQLLLLAGFIASGFLVGLTFRSHSNRRKHFEQGVKSGDLANGASRTDGCFTFFGKAAGIVEPGQEHSMSHRPGRIPRSGLLRAKASTSEPSSQEHPAQGFCGSPRRHGI